MTSTKNIGASVRARLLQFAHSNGDDFQLVLTRYANERLLYRLASSQHASRFVLKGATLFTVWTGKPHRATRDLDLLGFGDPSEDHIRELFTEVLSVVVEDGVEFDLASLRVGPIREDQDYGGVRVELTARITTATVRMQVDVGFGDAISPDAAEVEIPALLDDLPWVRIRAYPRETVVAEKVQAMVHLGMANSRMKDFYDVAELAKSFEFDGVLLAQAIRATFARRKTSIPTTLPVALTTTFSDDEAKRSQWNGFTRKADLHNVPSLAETIRTVAAFIEKPLQAARVNSPVLLRWPSAPSHSK